MVPLSHSISQFICSLTCDVTRWRANLGASPSERGQWVSALMIATLSTPRVLMFTVRARTLPLYSFAHALQDSPLDWFEGYLLINFLVNAANMKIYELGIAPCGSAIEVLSMQKLKCKLINTNSGQCRI